MKFRFSLASVLNHRERLERDAEIALGKEVQKLVKLENQLEELLEEYKNLVSAGAIQHGRAFSADRLMDFINYAERLKQLAAMKKLEIKQQSDEVEKARAELVKKTQDKKALEILRDSQKAEFKLAEKRMEAKQMDEAARNLLYSDRAKI